ncbi:hypothetical protein [uncultured Prevotella sp.]|uniref:hypothetical protein n=1 Tax=uncultured Prevotella sp. TaxID=159272 RepID=UPI0025DF67EB|nr:hypothetical protein [uncultured Prevotella sp.]
MASYKFEATFFLGTAHPTCHIVIMVISKSACLTNMMLGISLVFVFIIKNKKKVNKKKACNRSWFVYIKVTAK